MRNIQLGFWLAISLLCLQLGMASWVDAAPPGTTDWKMVFSDEFNGPSIDKTKWNTSYYWGRTNSSNDELQWYVDDAFEFQNGILRIRGDKQTVEGYHYTSGVLTTLDKFHPRYGYFEMRAKVPKGKGLWPAFWMLPIRSWPPEVDIMESIGQTPTTVYLTNHYGEPTNYKSVYGWYSGPDFTQDFHVYGLEWRSDALIWYIDGQERFRSTAGVPQEDMYLILNMAIGGKWPGAPDDTVVFPAYYEIDYVRAYTSVVKQARKKTVRYRTTSAKPRHR